MTLMKKLNIMSNFLISRIKYKSNPFSFWEIQPEQDFSNNYARDTNYFRFKNVGTNMYLCA